MLPPMHCIHTRRLAYFDTRLRMLWLRSHGTQHCVIMFWHATCRYHALLRTAKERGTVTYVSNLFDTFFAGGKDHRTRVSAGNMPYLEGVCHAGRAGPSDVGKFCCQEPAGQPDLPKLLMCSPGLAALLTEHVSDTMACPPPGDYWPGEAENLLLGIAEEARQAGKRAGKGAGSKANPAGRGGKKVGVHATAGSPGTATWIGCWR